jgi:hypothetical protein
MVWLRLFSRMYIRIVNIISKCFNLGDMPQCFMDIVYLRVSKLEDYFEAGVLAHDQIHYFIIVWWMKIFCSQFSVLVVAIWCTTLFEWCVVPIKTHSSNLVKVGLFVVKYIIGELVSSYTQTNMYNICTIFYFCWFMGHLLDIACITPLGPRWIGRSTRYIMFGTYFDRDWSSNHSFFSL